VIYSTVRPELEHEPYAKLVEYYKHNQGRAQDMRLARCPLPGDAGVEIEPRNVGDAGLGQAGATTAAMAGIGGTRPVQETTVETGAQWWDRR
jgi:hypothetical protein